MDWLNTNAAAVQGIAAAVVAVATVILGVITAIYAWQTTRLARETQHMADAISQQNQSTMAAVKAAEKQAEATQDLAQTASHQLDAMVRPLLVVRSGKGEAANTRWITVENAGYGTAVGLEFGHLNENGEWSPDRYSENSNPKTTVAKARANIKVRNETTTVRYRDLLNNQHSASVLA